MMKRRRIKTSLPQQVERLSTMLAVVAILLASIFSVSGCNEIADNPLPQETEAAQPVGTSAPTCQEQVVVHSPSPSSPIMAGSEDTKPEIIVPEQEIELMALLLSGECYDDKPEDKRKVCETVCNRVSDGRFGDSVEEVITAPNQFHGYWNQGREVSASDLEIAEEVLREWYAGGREPLSEWLYFCAGGNRENVFRKEY